MIKTLEELSDKDFKGPDRIYCWRITEKDVDKIMSYLSKFGESPRVLDVGCGSGLMSYLLAAKGCEVIAVDKEKKDNWDMEKENPKFTVNLIREVSDSIKDIDAVYCSWMPKASNWSNHFYEKINAPMIIHVIGETSAKFTLDDNEYNESHNRVVSGLSHEDQNISKEYMNRLGSPYQLSNYQDYTMLDAWRVLDYREMGDAKPLKLSKLRIDIKESLVHIFK